mmetsp:Transcript_15690/g.66112  ORF Transcript_15690/g.66112 Transcript_15690/m.66112 type:complete len:219 (+) Transcript_15690:210-866(+)
MKSSAAGASTSSSSPTAHASSASGSSSPHPPSPLFVERHASRGVRLMAASAPCRAASSGRMNRSPPSPSSQNSPAPVFFPGAPTLRYRTAALAHRSTAPPRLAARTSLSALSSLATPFLPPAVACPTQEPAMIEERSTLTSWTSGLRPEPPPAAPKPPPFACFVKRAASAACFLSAFLALRGRCFPLARGSPSATTSSRLASSFPCDFSTHLSKMRLR